MISELGGCYAYLKDNLFVNDLSSVDSTPGNCVHFSSSGVDGTAVLCILPRAADQKLVVGPWGQSGRRGYGSQLDKKPQGCSSWLCHIQTHVLGPVKHFATSRIKCHKNTLDKYQYVYMLPVRS